MEKLPSLNFNIEDYRDVYPFKSNYLDIDGLKYHYLDEGQGEPILMLHGNPTWSFYFRNLVKELRQKYRVIVPDHIGCGMSDKPQRWSYRLKDHISNVSRLIEHLQLKNITMVVHDWGGMIGFGTAVQQAENFRRFVVLNTGAFRLPKVNSFSARIALCKTPVVGRLAVRAFNAFARGASMFCAVGNRMTTHEKNGLMAPYNSYKNRIATHKFVKDIPLKPSHPSWDVLCNIENNLHLFKDHPMTIIWGMQDFCFDRHFLREWKKHFPEVPVHQFRHAGHYVLEDAREEVIELVNSFLEQSE